MLKIHFSIVSIRCNTVKKHFQLPEGDSKIHFFPNQNLTNPNHGSLFFSIFSGIPISKTIPFLHFEIQIPNHSMPFFLSRFLPHPLSFFLRRDIHIFEYLTIFQVLVKRPGHKARSQGQVTMPGRKAGIQCQKQTYPFFTSTFIDFPLHFFKSLKHFYIIIYFNLLPRLF